MSYRPFDSCKCVKPLHTVPLTQMVGYITTSACVYTCVCVCLLTSMHDQKDPCSNVCLCLIVYMCVRSLPQKGDETRYKLTLGSACCRFAQLSLAQVPWSDVELPVKQEAFKRWLESYGIACRNILKEVKHRGQRFP